MHSAVPLPGDVLWIRQRRWRVERARRDRNVVRIDVASRDERLTFLAPFDRPSVAERDESLRYARPGRALARLAHLIGRAHGWRTPACIVDARMEILAHQIEPALAMESGARRVLIADEVGLGKTIQAAVAIAHLTERDPASRVLIIVPGTLRDQWTRELADRFHVTCLVADRHGLDEIARAGAFGDSPWRRRGVWIASLDFLKQRHVLESLPAQPWDLVIVDEAHAACGESDRHEACDDIARRSRRVLLLTATPHSGDVARFERLLELGRVSPHGDGLTVFRRTRISIGLRIDRAVRWHRVPLSEPESRALRALRAYEAAALRAAGDERREAALLLLSVFRKRALSTMAALGASVRRRLAWLDAEPGMAELDWMQPRLDFEELADDVGEDERRPLLFDIGLDVRQERSWLRRLLSLADAAAARESKLRRVLRLIARAREPIIVFTEFRDSLQTVAQALAGRASVSTLHGGMTDAERFRQLDRFLSGGADVLLATDVAGQGLNLQSRARWVVSLELPWNPARLEQRLGRVDRIGQTRRVHLTLMVARDAAESGLLAHVARRVLTARLALGPDVLATAAPGEAALRAAILDGSDIEDRAIGAPSNQSHIPLCLHWRRPALAVAKRLAHSRALISWWRGPAPSAGPVWTRLDRLPALRRTANCPLLIFAVPIVSRTGEVVERHIVAVRAREISRSSSRAETAAAIEVARLVARKRLVARAARIARMMRGRIQHEAKLELDVADALLDISGPDEFQPGLFDRRGERAFEALREERQAAGESGRARIEPHLAAPAVEVGRPALDVALLLPG